MLDKIKQKITESSVRDKIEFVGFVIIGLIVLVMFILDPVVFITVILVLSGTVLLTGSLFYLIICHSNNEWTSFRDFIKWLLIK